MEVLTGYGTIAAPSGPVVATVGNFDGVHLGHQMLLAEARSEADRRGIPAAVVTFEPHPLKILAPERAPKMILTRRQKIEILGAFGIERIVIIPFSTEVAAVSAEEFVRRFLVDRIRAACVIVGEDFRFGRGRQGDVGMLRALGAECGFDLRAMRALERGGGRVSASHVRRAIEAGDVRQAAALMGRPFVLVGEVVAGHGRGRALRVPTANLSPENELIPAHGVYVTETLVELEWHPSVTNVGTRPTFDRAGFAIETHIPGLDLMLYKERLRIRFLERIRDERRFESPEALTAQIASDIERMRAHFRARGRGDAPW